MSMLNRLSFFVRSLPFSETNAVGARRQPIVIGHEQAQSYGGAGRDVAEQISQLKWVFAHASVGSNILDGLAELHAVDPGRFPLQFVATNGTPPAMTEAGKVYEYNRGNPGWKAKIDGFEKSLASGWAFPAIDIAINKLCYIDQWASVKYYIHSMCHLEARFPDTTFVYVTMPLTTANDFRNYRRNVFNDKLRGWTRANGKVLFDLADIESHDPEGNPVTFKFGQRACQRLCDGYTDDGGHLNPQGRQLAARGLYALAAAIVNRRDYKYGVASRAMPSRNFEAKGRLSTSASVIR